MPSQRQNIGRPRGPAWLGLSLLAFAPLQTTQLTCEKTGDTTLSYLELEVWGQPQIDFESDQRDYDVPLPVSVETALVRVQSTDPRAQVMFNHSGPNGLIDGGSFGAGGGERSFAVPEGESSIRISVKAPGGATDFHELRISRTVPVFPCTEQGIRNAIIAGGGPYTFDCGGLATVAVESEIVVESDVVLDGFDVLTISGTTEHAVVEVPPGITAELRRIELVDAGLGVANDGELIAKRLVVRSHSGQGIVNRGTASIVDSEITNNSAAGVYNDGTLEVIGGSISGNSLGLENYRGTASLIDVVVSSNGASRLGGGIFSTNLATLILRGCSVAENQADFGGGLYNLGETHVTSSTFSGNSAARSGGAIYNRGGSAELVLEGTSIVDNHAAAYGGGLMGYYYSAAEVIDSSISRNTAGYGGQTASPGGGGIYSAYGSSLAVTRATIADNDAESSGGGIWVGGDSALVLDASTVFGNVAHGAAGIANYTWADVVSYIVNSTVSGNVATSTGGAIVNYGGLEIVSSTIAANVAGGAGSAIANITFGAPGAIHIRGSLVQGDCSISTLNPPLLASEGYNIESPGSSCGFNLVTDATNVSVESLGLGSLEDHGGLTRTHALLPGSVALDAIPSAECLDEKGQQLSIDQRGLPRDSTCDVGAFEVQPR